MRFRKNNEVSNVVIEGLEFVNHEYKDSFHRIYTLLLKGLIIYCMSAGLIGCALTSTKSQFSHLIFNMTMASLSVIVCMIYYNKKTENIGDLLYIVLLVGFGLRYGVIINSGFYTWLNDIIGYASIYFDLPEIGGYVTKVSDINVSLTVASCYLGAIVVIVVNLSIIKKMHALDLVLDIILIMFLPSYLQLEPDYIYIILLITGLCMSIVWCMSGRFEKIDKNIVYTYKGKCITYNYNPLAHLYTFAQMAVVLLICLVTIFFVFPKDDYEIIRTKSELKLKTDEVIQIFVTSGLGGFFNQYDSIGGIKTGKLGGVSSVRLDYETDLEVTYVPYDMSPIYLRTFVASEYIPYDNRWLAADELKVNNNEFDSLYASYNDGNPAISKSRLIVKNIDGEYGEYYPYYSLRHSSIKRGESYDGTFYNINDSKPYLINKLTEEERAYWLSIPNDNRPSIINFVDELNLSDDMDELQIAAVIKDYFYENIPYTLRPGATPFRKDFINFFIDKNKKGYCVHFASTATLAFRQLGIPARYVEGYAFDYMNILEGEILENEPVEQYYIGPTLLDKKAVIKVNVSDANAHAWVEIYTDDYGWIPVELTPPSSEITMERESFLERFLKLFSGVKEEQDNEDEKRDFNSSKIKKFFTLIGLLILVVPVTICLIYIIGYLFRFIKADINQRLIYRYRLFLFMNRRRFSSLSLGGIDKCNNIDDDLVDTTSDKEIINPKLKMINYRSAMEYLYDDFVDKVKLDCVIKILEKAGFSNSLISKEEYSIAVSMLRYIAK